VKYRGRKQARAYLLEQGVPVGTNALANLAVTGEGPRFRYWGRHPVYTEDDLDAWVQQKLSQPVRAPTEAAALRRLTQHGRKQQKRSGEISPRKRNSIVA
jgi:hypothetical protein